MREGPRPRRLGRTLRIAAAVVLALAWLVAIAGPASAGSIDGCSGNAQSKDANGGVIDSATTSGKEILDGDGKPGATASNPLLVDNDGVVDYSGQSDAVITNHHWSIKLLGIEVASGGSANRQRTQKDSGTFDIGEEMPLKMTGLVKVDGDLTGRGGSCSGSGYVKLRGNALASPVTWAGILLAGIGGFGLFLARPQLRARRGVVA
jgi:hypothetical protein